MLIVIYEEGLNEDKSQDISSSKFSSFKSLVLPELTVAEDVIWGMVVVFFFFLKLQTTLKPKYFTSAGLGSSSMVLRGRRRCCKVQLIEFPIPEHPQLFFFFQLVWCAIKVQIFLVVCMWRCLICTLKVHYFWHLFLLQTPFRKAIVMEIQLIPSKSQWQSVSSVLKMAINLQKIRCWSHLLVLRSRLTDLRPDFLYLSASAYVFANDYKLHQLLCHLM